jgi:hypothetical protein
MAFALVERQLHLGHPGQLADEGEQNTDRVQRHERSGRHHRRYGWDDHRHEARCQNCSQKALNDESASTLFTFWGRSFVPSASLRLTFVFTLTSLAMVVSRRPFA